MAKTGPWRVKGVDRKTRRMARDAAARSGVPIGVWIDRAIRSRAAIVPRGDAKPLVPPEFLASARAAGPAAKAKKDPFLPALPAESGRRASPDAASGWRASGMAGRAMAGVLVLALMAGGYWLVAQGPTGGDRAPRNEDVAASAPAADGAASAVAAPTRIETLGAAARNGDAAAQLALGLIYMRGEGVSRDAARGAGWLEKSAAAGNAAAQFHLGTLYGKGTGVRRNDMTAFGWYRRAAEQGHLQAQHALGTLYAEGRGTARDYAEATRWLTRAAKGGLAESHYSLGALYEQGLGVEKDPRKAAAHYREALAAGSARAADKLARLEPALQQRTEPDIAAANGDARTESTGSGTLSPAGIVNLQRLLARLDLEPGPPTGVLGPQTVEAIKLYQRFAGLPVDGVPSLELLRDLRQVVGAMSAETTAPPQSQTPAAAPN